MHTIRFEFFSEGTFCCTLRLINGAARPRPCRRRRRGNFTAQIRMASEEAADKEVAAINLTRRRRQGTENEGRKERRGGGSN